MTTPSIKEFPNGTTKSLIFRLVTGIGPIMYCGWSSLTTHRTFRDPDCAASLAGTLKEASAAAPPTPNKNVLLLILRFIIPTLPYLTWPIPGILGYAAREAQCEQHS
jgi:hypothetical protein